MRRVPLTQFLIEQQHAGYIDADLRLLLKIVTDSTKTISITIKKGALRGTLGETGTYNIQGEAQKKLDVIANEIMLQTNEWGGYLSAMASEELDTIYPISDDYPKGPYLLLFDPLDGSSNIEINGTVGTIFSVLKIPQNGKEINEISFLQPGIKQVAAGYAIYGPSTQLVLTVGNGTHGFTLDRDIGSYIYTHPSMTIPAETAEYAINSSNARFWEKPVQRYVDELLQGKDGSRGKDFNMRWVASMVADVHRILIRGGIFMYPLDEKCRQQGGKLRLMYEANPMAFLVEQAGGAATTGRQRILDLAPEYLHQRVPVILGSKSEVERVTKYHQES